MNDYLIPFEYKGLFRCKATSAQDARELFEAMTDEEILKHADPLWADDRTFTPEEYEAAIKAVTEPAS